MRVAANRECFADYPNESIQELFADRRLAYGMQPGRWRYPSVYVPQPRQVSP